MIGGVYPRLLLTLIILIVLFITLIILQLKLSKTKEKICGLIIPSLTFIMFLTLFTSYIVFDKIEKLNGLFTSTVYITIALCLISTIVNFAIYCHNRKSKEIDLNKINIQDLN